jgi:hypothetical protein
MRTTLVSIIVLISLVWGITAVAEAQPGYPPPSPEPTAAQTPTPTATPAPTATWTPAPTMTVIPPGYTPPPTGVTVYQFAAGTPVTPVPLLLLVVLIVGSLVLSRRGKQ